MSTSSVLRNLIEQPPSVSISDLEPLALLDRVDSKYVLQEEQLRQVLAATLDDYYVLQVDGIRPHRYLNTYFDTPDFAMYFDHHNGKRSRYKVRCRTYVNSGITYVEVKMKTNKERTVKYRSPVATHLTQLGAGVQEWLAARTPYSGEELQPVVWNRFVRVTLANMAHGERITIDTELVFGSGERGFAYEGLCIVELKQPKSSLVRSPFAAQLRAASLRPQSISKFCVAVNQCYPTFKANRFKPMRRQLTYSFPLRGVSERTA